MKSKIKLIMIIVLLIIGFGLIIWSNRIIMNYDDFREVYKAARNEALPSFIGGFVIIVGAYILTYVK